MRDPVSNVPQTSQAVPSGRTPSLGRTIPQLTMRGVRSWWCASNRAALAGCLKELDARGEIEAKRRERSLLLSIAFGAPSSPTFSSALLATRPWLRQPDVRQGHEYAQIRQKLDYFNDSRLIGKALFELAMGRRAVKRWRSAR